MSWTYPDGPLSLGRLPISTKAGVQSQFNGLFGAHGKAMITGAKVFNQGQKLEVYVRRGSDAATVTFTYMVTGWKQPTIQGYPRKEAKKRR